MTVWDLEFLRAIAPSRPRVHVKLDTGMGRLGTKDVGEARAHSRRGGRRRARRAGRA